MDDLKIVSECDAERHRLDRIKKELEDEREKFTRAAVKLGKEKSTFEVGLVNFHSIALSLIFMLRAKGSGSWKKGDHGRFSKCSLSTLPPVLRKNYLPTYLLPRVWLLTFLR